LYFDNKGYVVEEQILRNEFAAQDGELETKVVYYRVRDWLGKIFWVKELRYNSYWYEIDAVNRAKVEWAIAMKLKEEKVDKCILPIAINENRLLYEYCNWPNILEVDGNIACINEIIKLAKRLGEIYRSVKSDLMYDLNPNNILYKDGDFRFIDFEMATCDYNERMENLEKYLRAKCT